MQRGQHKNVIFLVSSHDGDKKSDIFGPKICIFLPYTHITPIFWAQTDPTQWDHETPYLEVTLDTFCFPVGGRLAVWRAVSWPLLPKVVLFEAKNVVFAPKSIFCAHPPIFVVSIMTRHRQNSISETNTQHLKYKHMKY